jgi:uncharacterized membrane protein
VEKVILRIENEFLPLLLVGLVLLALIMAGVQGLPAPLPMLRLGLGLVYVLFAPGYALQAALFPRATDLDGPERLALSFGLSVAVVPPMALLLDALPWGIRLWPILAMEGAFLAVCSFVALYRRKRLEVQERPSMVWKLAPAAWWAGQDRTTRLLFGILGLALCMAAIAAITIIVAPKPGERLTEFYVLGAEGLAEDFPRQAVAGETLAITAGIANREGVPSHYRIEVLDATGTIGALGPMELQADESREWELTFSPREVGEDVRVDVLLYRDEGREPYRSLRLWIQVLDGAPSP